VHLFITFTCYGTHLPGDPSGSFDHIRDGERRFIPPRRALEKYHEQHLRQAPFLLETPESRTVVLEAIVNVCGFRSWALSALHVRSNHFHGIIAADVAAAKIIHDWKAYATRALRSSGLVDANRLIWTHGGGAQRVAPSAALEQAMRYVVELQGEPMALFCRDHR
jgi:hypothetical protein